jgi:hypothetical protein
MFDGRSWIAVNKRVARRCGFEAAGLLGELVAKRKYFAELKNEDDDENQTFFNTISDIEQSTTFTRTQQKRSLWLLKRAGFINYWRAATHGVKHFQLFDKAIIAFLDSDEEVQRLEYDRRSVDERVRDVCNKVSKTKSASDLSINDASNNNNNNNKVERKSAAGAIHSRRTLSSYSPARQELFRTFAAAWKGHFHATYRKKDWIGKEDWLEGVEDPTDAARYVPTFFKLPTDHFKGAKDWAFSLFCYKYQHNELQTFYPQTKEYHIERQKAKGY